MHPGHLWTTFSSCLEDTFSQSNSAVCGTALTGAQYEVSYDHRPSLPRTLVLPTKGGKGPPAAFGIFQRGLQMDLPCSTRRIWPRRDLWDLPQLLITILPGTGCTGCKQIKQVRRFQGKEEGEMPPARPLRSSISSRSNLGDFTSAPLLKSARTPSSGDQSTLRLVTIPEIPRGHKLHILFKFIGFVCSSCNWIVSGLLPDFLFRRPSLAVTTSCSMDSTPPAMDGEARSTLAFRAARGFMSAESAGRAAESMRMG